MYLKLFVKRGWNDGDFKVQFTSMQMLQDILANLAKKITLQLDINTIDQKMIATLEDFLERHKGENKVQFILYDLEEKMKLTMPSRTKKIAITNELISELDKMNYTFKLN